LIDPYCSNASFNSRSVVRPTDALFLAGQVLIDELGRPGRMKLEVNVADFQGMELEHAQRMSERQNPGANEN
jgi:hypothetical protein